MAKNKSCASIGNTSFQSGRGSRIRTHTGGFGDRCATIDTIPLYELTILILTYQKKKFNTKNKFSIDKEIICVYNCSNLQGAGYRKTIFCLFFIIKIGGIFY